MRARLRPSSNRTRRDGWTVERQLGFLTALARTRSITEAATSVGMSRESAYRLRAREDGGLFAALWDRALAPDAGTESHDRVLSDGQLARLLGNHFRRENNGVGVIGSRGSVTRPG